jgi:hypothetical protein
MTNAWSVEKPKDICAAMRLNGMINREKRKTRFEATLI